MQADLEGYGWVIAGLLGLNVFIGRNEAIRASFAHREVLLPSTNYLVFIASGVLFASVESEHYDGTLQLLCDIQCCFSPLLNLIGICGADHAHLLHVFLHIHGPDERKNMQSFCRMC